MIQYFKFEKKANNDLFVIRSDYKVEGIYLFLKTFYSLILNKIFKNVPVGIITINPTKDAVCYDFKNVQTFIENDNKYVVNVIHEPSDTILTKIANSFEFELGTLSIFEEMSLATESKIQIVNKHLSSDIENDLGPLIGKYCFCERDGYVIYLVNTAISQTELIELIEQAENLS